MKVNKKKFYKDENPLFIKVKMELIEFIFMVHTGIINLKEN